MRLFLTSFLPLVYHVDRTSRCPQKEKDVFKHKLTIYMPWWHISSCVAMILQLSRQVVLLWYVFIIYYSSLYCDESGPIGVHPDTTLIASACVGAVSGKNWDDIGVYRQSKGATVDRLIFAVNIGDNAVAGSGICDCNFIGTHPDPNREGLTGA